MDLVPLSCVGMGDKVGEIVTDLLSCQPRVTVM